MPPLSKEQIIESRIHSIQRLTNIYKKYIDANYKIPKQKDIEKYAKNDANYANDFSKEVFDILKSKNDEASKLDNDRQAFKARLLQNEMQPTNSQLDDSVIMDNLEANAKIREKYKAGPEGDKNELAQLEKYWQRMLRMDQRQLQFNPDDKPEDVVRKMENTSLLFSFNTLDDRKNLLSGEKFDKKEWDLLEEKRQFVQYAYQFRVAKNQLENNLLFRSLIGVDFLKKTQEEMNAINQNLLLYQAEQEMLINAGEKPDPDYVKADVNALVDAFSELRSLHSAYKVYEKIGPKQEELFKFLCDKLMFTNNGFNALCFDKNGNQIDPTKAIDDYLVYDAEFTVGYSVEFLNDKYKDTFITFIPTKTGIKTKEEAAEKRIDLVTKRLQIYQQNMLKKAEELELKQQQEVKEEIIEEVKPEEVKVEEKSEEKFEEKMIEDEIPQPQEEKSEEKLKEEDKAPEEKTEEIFEEKMVEDEIPQPEQEKAPEEKINEPQPEVKEVKPEAKPAEVEYDYTVKPAYTEPFAVPMMTTVELPKALAKDRFNKAKEQLKALNNCFVKEKKFQFSKDEFLEFTADQKKYNTHNYAKQYELFVESLSVPNNPNLTGHSITQLSNLIPKELQQSSTKDIIQYFVSRAYNADINWLMNTNDDEQLAKNMASQYANLKIASMGKEILTAAEKEGIKVPGDVIATIKQNEDMMFSKYQLAQKKLMLLADDNYALLPDLEAHGITDSMAASYVGTLSQAKGGDKFVPTFLKYMQYSSDIEAAKKEINVYEKLQQEEVFFELDTDKAECFILANDKVKQVGFREAIKAASNGSQIAVFEYRDGKARSGKTILVNEDGSLEIETRRRYAIIKDVEGTPVEKEFERKRLEELVINNRVKKELEERTKLLKNLSEAIYTKAYGGVDAKDIPENIKKNPELYQDYLKVNRDKWKRINENVNDYLPSEDELRKHFMIKDALKQIKAYKHTEVKIGEETYSIADAPWMMYQLFDAPSSNEAEQQKIGQHNKEIYEAFDFRDDVYSKLDELEKNKFTAEGRKALDEFRTGVLSEPLKYVKDPARATQEAEKLFKKVLTECDPKWFDDLSDEQIVSDWAQKAPYFALFDDANFIKSMKTWGVKISRNDMELYKAEQQIITGKLIAAKGRVEALASSHIHEALNTGLNASELFVAKSTLRDNVTKKFSEANYAIENLEQANKYGKKADDFIRFLNGLGCLGHPDNISKGKSFYNKNGLQLGVGDAMVRIHQNAGKPKNLRVGDDNIVYVVDHTTKSCKCVQLNDKGEYASTDADYSEFQDKIKLSESKTTVVDEGKALDNKKLGVTLTIQALEHFKKRLDKTDFPIFVGNKTQISEMRKSLDEVLGLYKNLKLVPLESDINKLTTALTKFNGKIADYILYKEELHHLDAEHGYPDGYLSNTIKAQEELSWRAFTRLDSAYQLQALTKALMPNVKSDVLEFALYNQQQRIMHHDDIVINPKKPELKALFDKTLAELRIAKADRVQQISEGMEAMEYFVGFTMSTDSLEEGHLDLKVLNYADDLLVSAYDFEINKKKAVYSDAAKEKIYNNLAKLITTNMLCTFSEKTDYQAVKDLDLSGFDKSDNLDLDINRLAQSEEMKKFFPPEKLTPLAVVQLVSNRANILKDFAKVNGIDPATLIRRYQVERGAVIETITNQGVKKLDVNLMPTDKEFNKQAMQDKIDEKVNDLGDIDTFLKQ